ncbi:MAG: hypothetical protein AAGD86_02600 [Pseudomonadota bacterium]
MRRIPHHQTLYTSTRPLGVLGTVAAVVGLAVAAIFGAVFFLLLLGIMLVLGAVLAARFWWTTRALRAELQQSGDAFNDALRRQAQAGQAPPGDRTSGAGGETIEGEFTELDR